MKKRRGKKEKVKREKVKKRKREKCWQVLGRIAKSHIDVDYEYPIPLLPSIKKAKIS